MNLVSFLTILVYFLLANLTTVIISKRTFGKCLPFTLMLCAFLLFFSQITFKTFNIGFYLGLIYSLSSLGYLIYKHKDKKILGKIKDNYLTCSFYSFIIILVLITIFDFNRTFSHWDEYSHWGEMLKEMIRTDKFYSVSASVLQAHKDYPPLLQLFELFVIKLCGGYKETFATVSLHLLELSLLISILPEKKKVKKITSILGTVSIFLIFFLTTIFFDLHGIVNSIYNDYFMALLVSYSLSVVFFSKDKKSMFTLVNLAISSAFLLLTKQIGLTLYLMILFFYFVSLFLEKEKKEKIITKKNIKFFVKTIIMLIIIPLLLFGYWNNFVKTVNIPSQFNTSDIKLSKLYSIYRGRSGRDDQKIAAGNFITSIKGQSLSTSYIPMTYLQAVILGLFLLYIIYTKNKDLIKKNKLYLLIFTLSIGALGYAFVMWCTYIFCFKDTEAIYLASFDRYMSTYVLIIMYFAIMLLVYCCYKKEKINILLSLAIILFLLTAPAKISYLTPSLIKKDKSTYEVNAEIIKEKVKDNEKVFIIAEDSQGEYQYFVKYYANPIITNMKDFNWPTDDDTDYEKYYNSIKNKIKDYDYLYVAVANDKFKEKYQFVFDEEIKSHQLYKIEKKDDKNYKLILINRGGNDEEK